MEMNYYAIQIFHARLKVKILTFDVNLGRQKYRVSQKFAILRGTVHCCFVVKFCFSRVSDRTGNKWSKCIFIQIYN